MTLFFDGIPSSGGPRCLGCLGVRVLVSAVPSAGCSVVAAALSLVASVKGRTWPGTLVGASVAAPLV